MQKNLLTACAVFLLTAANIVNAQVSFSHSAGGGVYVGSSDAGYALMYAPRLNVVELGNEMNLSVGTNIGLGFSGSSNSQTGSSGSLLLDLPILAELNFGHAADENANSDFGGFAGVGYGYNKMASSVETIYGTASSNTSSAGVVFCAGFRGLIKDQSLDLRVSYMLNMKTGGANIFGLGVFYNIGMN
jgi:hypothetical protein